MLKSLFHWKVLVNLLLAIALFVGLVWLTFRWLEFHTNHGKEIPVPNVMNMPVQKAIEILDDSGLAYEVDSFNFDPQYKPYQVLQISPIAGSHVKGGRTVYLKVNPRTWPPVAVPDIIDRYKGLAFSQLDRVGLKVGDTIYEPNIQRDAVIRMLYNGSTLKPGSLVPRFSAIDLVIGTGPKRNIPVPNVVGLTVAEAKKVIAQNLFEVGLVEYESGTPDESNIVYYMDPEAGSLRDQGMQIDLWASSKTPAEMGAKISYLNSIHRMKIDTTLPPVRYEEVPTYSDPIESPEPTREPDPVPVAPKEVTKAEAPKVTPKVNEKPKESKQTTQNKPSAEKKSTTTPSKTQATNNTATTPEKPKGKKVVD